MGQRQPGQEQLREAAVGGGDGKTGTAALLENWEEDRHSWMPPASRSAGDLHAATALMPSSSARGAAALFASVRVFYGAERDGEIPLPPACRHRSK